MANVVTSHKRTTSDDLAKEGRLSPFSSCTLHTRTESEKSHDGTGVGGGGKVTGVCRKDAVPLWRSKQTQAEER